MNDNLIKEIINRFSFTFRARSQLQNLFKILITSLLINICVLFLLVLLLSLFITMKNQLIYEILSS